MRYSSGESRITVVERKGLYTYYKANISICHKRYTSTFPYTEEGYKNAQLFIKSICNLYEF